MISAAKHLPGFKYDPKVCSLKTWLLRLTRWRIIDQLRKRLPLAGPLPAAPEDDATAIGLLESFSDGTAPEFDALWSTEWENLLLTKAIERVKPQVRPEQFQMFDLYAHKGMPVSQVASLLGVSAARVYLAKHRVSKLLRAELKRLEGKDV